MIGTSGLDCSGTVAELDLSAVHALEYVEQSDRSSARTQRFTPVRAAPRL